MSDELTPHVSAAPHESAVEHHEDVAQDKVRRCRDVMTVDPQDYRTQRSLLTSALNHLEIAERFRAYIREGQEENGPQERAQELNTRAD